MRLKSIGFIVVEALFLLAGCSRTGLWQLIPEAEEQGGGSAGSAGRGASGGSAGKGAAECVTTRDCPVVDPCAPPACVTGSNGVAHCEARPLDCDDGNPCTLDRCNTELGRCENAAPIDGDRDGYLGKAPSGSATGCGGEDCDDRDASVHPGATEYCNSKDDDCDGAIDEGDDFRVAGSALKLAPELERSQHGGIAWNESAYGVVYSGASATNQRRVSYFGVLNSAGERTIEPVLVSDINADTFQGSVEWSGDSFLTAWADARQAGDYEIYTTRFDATGGKLSPDQRVTDADGKSLRPGAHFTGSEYLLNWDDHRFEDEGGVSAIFGRRLSQNGAALGSEVRLTAPTEAAEYGALAVGEERVVLAYIVKTPGSDFAHVQVRQFDHSFENGAGPLEIGTDSAAEVRIVALTDGFLVAWATGSQARGWGSQIAAALLDRQGNLVKTTRTLTTGDTFARTRALVSLGDRTLLIWSGAGPDGVYSLHYQVFEDLFPRGERRLLASSPAGGSLVDPVAALGASGEIGVLFDEDKNGLLTGYFARLSCEEAPR